MNTESKGTVLYVGPFSFPDGGAAARRILGVSQSLQEAGFKVTVASGQMAADGLAGDSYCGIEVYSMDERTAEDYPPFMKRAIYFTMGKKTVHWLRNLETNPAAVILYSGYSPYMWQLRSWSRETGVPLIFDAVEWYDPPSIIKGLISPYYWNIELAMRFLAPKFKNIIAISSYLTEYFAGMGCNTVNVPPTLDVSSFEARLNSDNPKGERIVIGYTGSPGHKDLFDNVLEAFERIDSDGKRLALRVAGITESELLEYPAMKKRARTTLPAFLSTIGKTSHVRAISLTREADFTVLLRPRKRYAQAGFPTKFVESMAMGTPVIVNVTSDLDKYVCNDSDSIVCADPSPTSLVSALEKALTLTRSELSSMRVNARKRAESAFDFKMHTPAISSFLDKVVANSAATASTY